MTHFITVRSTDIGGKIQDAWIMESSGGDHPSYIPLDAKRVGEEIAGKELVLAVHGFNVSRPKGVRSMITLEAALDLSPDQAFFGVLWPGDFWLPVVNYPAEARDAVKSGAKIAALLNGPLSTAGSYTFVSHSLGGRVLLETVSQLDRTARVVCITAGAVDDNCLQSQYAEVKDKADRIHVLASERDVVLQLAYPLGDFASDLLWRDNDSPWRGALGRSGPNPGEARPRVQHRQIPSSLGYDHGDYFPPGDGSQGGPKWRGAADYIRACLDGKPDTFPERRT